MCSPSSVLHITDFVLVALIQRKYLCKYQNGSCQDGLKLQNTAMELLSFPLYWFLTNIKLQGERFNISEGDWTRAVEVCLGFRNLNLKFEIGGVNRGGALPFIPEFLV